MDRETERDLAQTLASLVCLLPYAFIDALEQKRIDAVVKPLLEKYKVQIAQEREQERLAKLAAEKAAAKAAEKETPEKTYETCFHCRDLITEEEPYDTRCGPAHYGCWVSYDCDDD